MAAAVRAVAFTVVLTLAVLALAVAVAVVVAVPVPMADTIVLTLAVAVGVPMPMAVPMAMPVPVLMAMPVLLITLRVRGLRLIGFLGLPRWDMAGRRTVPVVGCVPRRCQVLRALLRLPRCRRCCLRGRGGRRRWLDRLDSFGRSGGRAGGRRLRVRRVSSAGTGG